MALRKCDSSDTRKVRNERQRERERENFICHKTTQT